MYLLTAHQPIRALHSHNTTSAGVGPVPCRFSITRKTFLLRGRKGNNTGVVSKLPKHINSFRLLARKQSGAGTFNNVNEYAEEELDKLLDEYGEIVFTNPNQRSPSAELNDDAESLSFVVALAKAADDVKAADIQVLCVKRLVYWTSFFIIATAFSNPQIDAIGKKMRDIAEQQFKKFPTGDVKPNSWTLLDFEKHFAFNDWSLFFFYHICTFPKITICQITLSPKSIIRSVCCIVFHSQVKFQRERQLYFTNYTSMHQDSILNLQKDQKQAGGIHMLFP